MKYKLIKEYPGSPKLGSTIDNLENDWIENYPEFWELVVEKVKTPLFTTEDGVDIFKNIDKYYTPIYIVDKALNIKYCEKDFSVKPSENVKYFFNKEKAEEYILLNKPVLSLNDIEFAISKTNNAEEKRNKLKDLIKSKIQQSV